jgi:hypothetical protein
LTEKIVNLTLKRNPQKQMEIHTVFYIIKEKKRMADDDEDEDNNEIIR